MTFTLDWFPPGEAIDVWHSDQLVRYWDQPQDGNQLRRGGTMPESLFEETAEGVYEGSGWYEGNFSASEVASTEIPPELNYSAELIAQGKQNFARKRSSSDGSLLPIDIKFTHILGKKYPPLAPPFLLVNDEYGQPANGQLSHSDWGAASFLQTSSSKAEALIKRWNYADTSLGGGGSCNSISDSSPQGYNGAGGIQIDVNWQPVGNKKLKIKFRFKAELRWTPFSNQWKHNLSYGVRV